MHKSLFACVLMLASLLANAGEPPPPAVNQDQERHVMAISEQLRCLVCQNQTIADSNADLALDLKKQVREKVALGMSDAAILDYMVQRYGDFVLYQPPLKTSTYLLWFGPFLLLIGGLWFLGVHLRRQRPRAPVSDADLQRAAHMLQAPADEKDGR